MPSVTPDAISLLVLVAFVLGDFKCKSALIRCILVIVTVVYLLVSR